MNGRTATLGCRLKVALCLWLAMCGWLGASTSGHNENPKPARCQKLRNAIFFKESDPSIQDVDRLTEGRCEAATLRLVNAQQSATGRKAIRIAYLLAAMKHEYRANTDTLLDSLKRNRAEDPFPESALYLEDLFNRGDTGLLGPLMSAGPGSDGAWAELLGDFYADVLKRRPRLFLLELSKQEHAREIAELAGATDGSGMGPATLRKIRRSLTPIADSKDPLAPTARLCLEAVESVNRELAPQ